jgi:hypothetical protein
VWFGSRVKKTAICFVAAPHLVSSYLFRATFINSSSLQLPTILLEQGTWFHKCLELRVRSHLLFNESVRMAWNGTMINEWMVNLKNVLVSHFSGETGENHEKHQSVLSVPRLRFKLGTAGTQVTLHLRHLARYSEAAGRLVINESERMWMEVVVA